MLGYGAEELRDMPFTRVAHPDDVALDWHLFTERVSGKSNRCQLSSPCLRVRSGCHE